MMEKANKIYIQLYTSPFGELLLGTFNNELCLCDWRYRKMRKTIDERVKRQLNASYDEGKTEVLEEAKHQLNQYFNKDRKEFDIPLLLVGTDFQKKVWKALLQIPFGKQLSYIELSRNLGNEKAIRAVASANGANALSIIVPCHRVVGADGKLVGYAGGLNAKKQLLQLEASDENKQLELF